jgi:hypothetical protein
MRPRWGVCVLLLFWQIITCIYKHARRTAPQPRATPEASDFADFPPDMWALVAVHSDGLVDVAADERVQGGASGGEGVSGHPLLNHGS